MQARLTSFATHFEGIWRVIVYKPFESVETKQRRTTCLLLYPQRIT